MKKYIAIASAVLLGTANGLYPWSSQIVDQSLNQGISPLRWDEN